MISNVYIQSDRSHSIQNGDVAGYPVVTALLGQTLQVIVTKVLIRNYGGRTTAEKPTVDLGTIHIMGLVAWCNHLKFTQLET